MGEGILAQMSNTQRTYEALTYDMFKTFVNDSYKEPQPTEYGEGDIDAYNYVMHTGTKGVNQMWFVMHCMFILNNVDKSLYADDRFRKLMNKLYGRQHGKKVNRTKNKPRRHETVRQRLERKAKKLQLKNRRIVYSRPITERTN